MIPVPTGDQPLAADGLRQEFRRWAEEGWLRRLDAAFADFIARLDPAATPPVLLAAALLAQMESRGHSCLPLGGLLADAGTLLDWPAPALKALAAVMADMPARVEGWTAAVGAGPVVDAGNEKAEAAADGPGPAASPLVLRDGRLYLRRYHHHEQQVAAAVLARVAPAADAGAAVDVLAVRRWLDRLFEPAAGVDPSFDWQKAACAIAVRRRLAIVTGGPGTGKTTTAARVLALLFAISPHPEGLRVALAAPTGKAAARLQQSLTQALKTLEQRVGDALPLRALASHIAPARTLHALLGARSGTRRFAHGAARPLLVDVLIVDEASMVHLEMMAAVLAALPPQARLVLLGDKDQLASVEAGAVLGDLCRGSDRGGYAPSTVAYLEAVTGQSVPAHWQGPGTTLSQQTVTLRRSHRFEGAIGTLAAAVNLGDGAAALALLQHGSDLSVQALADARPLAAVAVAIHGRPGASSGHAGYLARLGQRPAGTEAAALVPWAADVLAAFARFRVLCAVRDGEWGAAGLNAAIERALATAGLIVRRDEWYEGRPMMVTRNDPDLGVFNGDIGIVLRSQGGALRAWFADGGSTGSCRSLAVSRLPAVETAYAMTVHKSQGSEFEHTLLVLPQAPSRVLTRELVYTGITRARSALTLALPRPAALGEALARTTQRAGGLAAALGQE